MHENPMIFTTTGYEFIECMVISETTENTRIRNVDGIHLTEWHPIRKVNGEWFFPADKADAELIATPDYVYNIVTENRSNLWLCEGSTVIEYATPGHSKTTKKLDSVSYHEYWATEAYVDDIKNNVNYKNGVVLMVSDSFPTVLCNDSSVVCMC